MTTALQLISCAQALAQIERFDAIVDVRSESEYADDHIPGAINCPVLSDAERADVGTRHKQASAFDARRHGAALVARNIAAHLEGSFADKPRNWRPLVYCWRGGQRSGAMATVLARVGWSVRQLEGGYRAFRRAVIDQLAQLPLPLDFRVVCGTTGSGKSRLLQHLAAAGAQVLDLEALACHRGSVLGGLPQQPQPSQKMFETQLWWRLRGFDAARPVFVESESRKVGDLRVPDELISQMRASPCIQLELPLAERVRLLREEYLHYERDLGTLFAQLDCLTALHGRERIADWKRLAESERWESLVERLLVEHYDPAYQKSIDRNFAQIGTARVVRAETADAASYDAIARSIAAG